MILSYEDIEIEHLNIKLLILWLCSMNTYSHSEEDIIIPKSAAYLFDHVTKNTCEHLLEEKVFKSYTIDNKKSIIKLYWVNLELVSDLLDKEMLLIFEWLAANWTLVQRIMYRVADDISSMKEKIEINILWFFLTTLLYLKRKWDIVGINISQNSISYGRENIQYYYEHSYPLIIKYELQEDVIDPEFIFEALQDSLPEEFVLDIINKGPKYNKTITYNTRTHTFIYKDISYEIPNTYHKFLGILLRNKWKRVTYKEIVKKVEGENDLSDGIFKWNFLKCLRNNKILDKDEEIIIVKNHWCMIP